MNNKILDMSLELNSIIGNLKTNKTHKNIQFYTGNYAEQIEKILSKACPFGKVATLYYNSTYLELGQNFSNALKTKGFKPLSIIMPDNFCNSVEDYSRLFTLPEDVRAIITFDYDLNNAIKYFGAIKNIDAIHVLREFNELEFISPKIVVKNEQALETLILQCNQHVVLDENLYNVSLPKIYAYVASKIVSLLDYRIYLKLSSKTPAKACYDLLNTAIDNALTCFNQPIENRNDYLLQCLFTAEIANRLSGGIIYEVGCEDTVKRLLEKFEGYDRIVFLKYSLNLYKKYFSGEYEHLLEIPNYNERAYKLSKILKVDDKELMQNLLAQIRTLTDSTDKKNSLKNSMLDQVIKAEKLVRQISSTYHALGGGGKESKNLKTSIYLAGDLKPTINGMSFVRENGILEFLEV